MRLGCGWAVTGVCYRDGTCGIVIISIFIDDMIGPSTIEVSSVVTRGLFLFSLS